MKWDNPQAHNQDWHKPIENRSLKMGAAQKLAHRLKDGDVVGAGSGSTSFLTLKVLAKHAEKEGLTFRVIPTSLEIEQLCAALSIPVSSLTLERPDWSFDGADEVDEHKNLIKGRGGALFKEKLVIAASKEPYIVVDKSKYVRRLGQNFPVPIEAAVEAVNIVEEALLAFPHVTSVTLRQAVAKDGPVITEAGNIIFDVRFDEIPKNTEKKLKAITGVIETGLFIGYPITVI